MNTKPIGNSESKAAKEKYSKLAIQSIEFSRRSDEITKEMNSLQKELGKRKLAGQRTVDIYEKMDSLSKEKTELTSASTEIQNQLGILNADVDYFTGEELKEGITSIFGSCDKLALEFYQAMQKAGELFKQLKEKDRVYFQSAMWLSAHCIQPP